MIAKAECEYDPQEDLFWQCKGRTVYMDYDGLSQQVLATRLAPYKHTPPNTWSKEGDDYLWTFVPGPTGTVIQMDERGDNDPEDDPGHYMMPDVHGGNVASLYQPMDLEEPREAMFQQFEAFGNAMTARTSAATGSYGWPGQEGSETEFLDSGEGNAAAQSSPNPVYMQARHYDPTIGRFLQADPLKMSSFTTQGLNRYIYCNNDPVNGTDPEGLWYDTFTASFAVGVALGVVRAMYMYRTVFFNQTPGRIVLNTVGMALIGYLVNTAFLGLFKKPPPGCALPLLNHPVAAPVGLLWGYYLGRLEVEIFLTGLEFGGLL